MVGSQLTHWMEPRRWSAHNLDSKKLTHANFQTDEMHGVPLPSLRKQCWHQRMKLRIQLWNSQLQSWMSMKGTTTWISSTPRPRAIWQKRW